MLTPRREVPAPRARRLSTVQRVQLAGEIAQAYLEVRRELRRAPIAAALAVLRRDAEKTPPALAARTLSDPQRLGDAVTRILVLLPGDTRCLTRALVLTRLLARRGIRGKLVIGARSMPRFSAHAWVECDGIAVLPAGHGSFGRLVEL
jgi:hypothetical protein